MYFWGMSWTLGSSFFNVFRVPFVPKRLYSSSYLCPLVLLAFTSEFWRNAATPLKQMCSEITGSNYAALRRETHRVAKQRSQSFFSLRLARKCKALMGRAEVCSSPSETIVGCRVDQHWFWQVFNDDVGFKPTLVLGCGSDYISLIL